MSFPCSVSSTETSALPDMGFSKWGNMASRGAAGQDNENNLLSARLNSWCNSHSSVTSVKLFIRCVTKTELLFIVRGLVQFQAVRENVWYQMDKHAFKSSFPNCYCRSIFTVKTKHPFWGMLPVLFDTKTGIVRISVIFQHRPMSSHMNGKLLQRPSEWYGWTWVHLEK